MNINKKLAICVQTYNGDASNLNKTFGSIFSQSEKSFDTYLIDNGSNEKFAKIYEDFCDKHNIKLIRVRTNEGIGSGRNAALEVDADYLLRVDIGDEIEGDFVKKTLKAISKNDFDLIIFREIFNGKLRKNFKEKLMSIILGTKKIHNSGMLDTVFNLNFIREIKFSYPNNLIEDYNSNILLFASAKKVKRVNAMYIKPECGMSAFHQSEAAIKVLEQSKKHYLNLISNSFKYELAAVNFVASNLPYISKKEIFNRFSGIKITKKFYWNPFREIARRKIRKITGGKND